MLQINFLIALMMHCWRKTRTLFGTCGGQSLAKSRFRLLWIGAVMMKALLISLQQPSVRYVYLTHLNDMKITAKISTAVLLSM